MKAPDVSSSTLLWTTASAWVSVFLTQPQLSAASPAMRPTNFWRWSSLRTSGAWFGIARCCVRLSPLARKPQRHFVPNSTSASCRRWGRVWSCRRCLVSPCSAFRPAPGLTPFLWRRKPKPTAGCSARSVCCELSFYNISNFRSEMFTTLILQNTIGRIEIALSFQFS